jgi:metalloendopeptidase OMA1, mitochondrial
MAETLDDHYRTEYGPRALPADHPLTQYIAQIVNRLLKANELGTLGLSKDDVVPGSATRKSVPRWNLVVVDDPETVNATASYGHIVVFSGIIPLAKNEDDVAAILAHGTPSTLSYRFLVVHTHLGLVQK